MKQFIGSKIINAKPMTRGEYNAFRGWVPPEGEAQDVDGYLVEYTDGGEPNTAEFSGYVSWTPKPQFDTAYRETSGLSFGLALEAMKKGERVARAGTGRACLCITFRLSPIRFRLVPRRRTSAKARSFRTTRTWRSRVSMTQ